VKFVKFRLTRYVIALVLFALTACNAAETTGTFAAPNVNFKLTPLPRLSGDTVSTVTVDDMEQSIFKIDDSCYGSLLNYESFTYYLGESLAPNMEIVSVPLQYMGQPVYSWVESRGAASALNHYISFRYGEPVYLYGIEGQVSYADLNGGGLPEIIASSVGSLPPQVVIYFWDDSEYGTITSLNVAETLKAYAAVYRDERFWVSEKEGAPEKAYIYSEGKLIAE
jgi:hypothetical protein